MADSIQFRRGLRSTVKPLPVGMPGFIEDEERLVIGKGDGTNTELPNKADMDNIDSQMADIAVTYISNYIFLVHNLGEENEDWSDAIQTAINNTSNPGKIIFPNNKILQITKQIILKKGIVYEFGASVGYYNGITYYADTSNTGITARIKAISSISGGMLKYSNNGTDNKTGMTLRDCLLDGNKLADNGLEITGIANSLKEDCILLDNFATQATIGDGLKATNTLANKFNNINISACNGNGIGLYACSDSVITNPYIHTCNKNGIYCGPGSAENQIIGGKIEDNYSNGIECFNSVIKIISTIFHANNGKDLYAHDDAHIFANSIKSSSSNQTGETGNKLMSYCINGSSIQIIASTISDVDYLGDSNDNNSSYSLLSNSIKVNIDVFRNPSLFKIVRNGNIINSVKEFINNGTRFINTDIDPNTSKTITFSNSIKLNEKFPNNYFKMGAYLLVIQTAKYPNANNGAITGTYLISIGQAGTELGITITPIQAPLDTTWINNVSGAIINNSDIQITINGGASVGSDVNHKGFYLSLVELGINGLNS